MPPVRPAPDSVFECTIVKELLSKAPPGDELYPKTKALIGYVSPLLDAIVEGPFSRFTLHNRDHSKKLVHLAGTIIPEQTRSNLTILDYVLLIYACFLHDLGLSLSYEKRNEILASQDYLGQLRSWPELSNTLQQARDALQSASDNEKPGLEVQIADLHGAALCNYLRPKHATAARYRELIDLIKRSTKREDLFSYRGVSFEHLLIDICVSHNEPASALAQFNEVLEDAFPRDAVIAGETTNTQFCAGVLRLADILDFDRERTPYTLFESLGIAYQDLPGASVTLEEWQKHLSIHSLAIDELEITVSGESHHPVIERSIRDFCATIEREIRDTLAVLRRNRAEIAARYSIDLPVIVRPKIRSVGYIFKDLSLHLNQTAITKLLMGERLYSNKAVAVRELLQNSIDACLARKQFAGEYDAHIGLRYFRDSESRVWLEVADNGIGMDEHVLSEYFLTLGNSYYSSTEFDRLLRSKKAEGRVFTSIARFGIGIASVFMIADVLEVATQCSHSLTSDVKARRVRIERLGSLAFVTEGVGTTPGTVIRLRLKRDIPGGVAKFLKQVQHFLSFAVVRPRVPLTIQLEGPKLTLKPNEPFRLTEDGRRLAAKMGLEFITVDLSNISSRLLGTVVMIFAIDKDGQLTHLWKGAPVRIGPMGVNPGDFFTGYTGNRVTVNGFRMGLKKMAKLMSLGNQKIALLLDVDIPGEEDITYDISRDKVLGEGKFKIATEFRDSLLKFLTQSHIIERLSDETRSLITAAKEIPSEQLARQRGYLPVDSHRLEITIFDVIPDGIWRRGTAHAIAKRLQLPLDVVVQHMRLLLGEGLLHRDPDYEHQDRAPFLREDRQVQE